jgi:hypothetical protein
MPAPSIALARAIRFAFKRLLEETETGARQVQHLECLEGHPLDIRRRLRQEPRVKVVRASSLDIALAYRVHAALFQRPARNTLDIGESQGPRLLHDTARDGFGALDVPAKILQVPFHEPCPQPSFDLVVGPCERGGLPRALHKSVGHGRRWRSGYLGGHGHVTEKHLIHEIARVQGLAERGYVQAFPQLLHQRGKPPAQRIEFILHGGNRRLRRFLEPQGPQAQIVACHNFIGKVHYDLLRFGEQLQQLCLPGE